jgi:glycosyltransferase involved in cell wall biosynthesis
MLTADALLFMETSAADSLSAKGVLTTKLFEYLAAGRPIVADIEPRTIIGEVIERGGTKLVCSTDPAQLAEALQKLVSGDFVVAPDREYVASFSRARQTQRLEALLLRLVGEKTSRPDSVAVA